MMKIYVLLIILVVSILIGISLTDSVIVVQLVIPNELLPYYDWLISFPGIKPLPEPPTQEIIPSNKIYQL